MVYRKYLGLLKELGPQGWWPVSENGALAYHPGDYSSPRNERQQWEICMGAILTQNTNWRNAEKAIMNLLESRVISPENILKIKKERLARLIRPSGYYNQKAIKLRELAKRVIDFGGTEKFLKKVSREELLKIKGIGPETADSILLYAGKRPYFVVDAYTRKMFALEGNYEEIRKRFEDSLPKDWTVYNEFHALIVAKGKIERGG